MPALVYPAGVKPEALVSVTAFSIYRDHLAVLPARMAWMAPDAAEALTALDCAVGGSGGFLYLSDCYRSELDQAKARFDFLTGVGRLQERKALVARYRVLRDYEACNGGLGKKAGSPAPGLSWHEAGRAIDLDMGYDWLGIDQNLFREIAESLGWICGAKTSGDPRKVDISEEWHWQFQGPFVGQDAAKRAVSAVRLS